MTGRAIGLNYFAKLLLDTDREINKNTQEYGLKFKSTGHLIMLQQGSIYKQRL